MGNKMLLTKKDKHGLKKAVYIFLILILIFYDQWSFPLVYSFCINKRSFVLNSIGKNDNAPKYRIRDNGKTLLEIGNSIKEQNVSKALANLDELFLAAPDDKKLSKKMSTICGNVLNLCGRFNDINNMIKVIEKMKIHNIEMQENSYLAICNYYISNNYIYEYILTINKMIEKNITIRERFYKYILVHILDLSFEKNYASQRMDYHFNDKYTKDSLISGREINHPHNNIHMDINNNERNKLIKNIDYNNFDKYQIMLNKYDITLEEEDQKYILHNYLLIDIFKHMNDNKIKIKLIYLLKLIYYVYENIQYIIRKNKTHEHLMTNYNEENISINDTNQRNFEKLKDKNVTNNKHDEDQNNDNNNNNNNEQIHNMHKQKNTNKNKKLFILKDILIEQLRQILELYKMNYESMNINIKKYEETLDEEERRSIYYNVNKITKRLPFIKLTENVKNTYNCKNCDENINTYFLSLKHIIIVIINIIMITHQFNNKEILKIKHFFSILNGPIDYTEGNMEKKEQTEISQGNNQKIAQGEQNQQDDNNITNEINEQKNSNILHNQEQTNISEKNHTSNINEVNKLFDKGNYTCLLDGANIGYNKQNVENGRFSFLQIEILKEIIKKKNNEKPLIILPKIYHYKNSLKYLHSKEDKHNELESSHKNENEEDSSKDTHLKGKKNSHIFIPNKTIKIKKTSPFFSEPRHFTRRENDISNFSNSQMSDNIKDTSHSEKNESYDNSNDALSYIKRIFNRLDNTDVDIIKKWEKEKCLYICNYNMYDDYYYILGSLAKSNNLFNIYYYIDELSKHFHKYQTLNHNIIIDNYNIIDNNLVYNNREVLYVHNNVIYDRNSDIMVLVSEENMNRENKYISMNEQYYNDKIKKNNANVKLFEQYKNNMKFLDKDIIKYNNNIFMDTYIYDIESGQHILVNPNEDDKERISEHQISDNNKDILKKKVNTLDNNENILINNKKSLKDIISESIEQKNNKEKEKNKKNNNMNNNSNTFYYSNIYIKCVTHMKSVQKPIYIYTNDKMKNHYFNEYTNYILKKWKKKSFISFYFKQPVILSEIKEQAGNNAIDVENILQNYRLPFVNLENFKLYIDDIVSYKQKNVYHIKINTPYKTFMSYQKDNFPYMSHNNTVKYLCIDFSKI
ncbi:conserved Plasmodium protein, unknown function [Plasmodium sp. gorilla clade G3]|nr:conserved Plasmodium protein, unknown function [Plasmodium sp. gorilla clade G3]